jgi:hypothetical protein
MTFYTIKEAVRLGIKVRIRLPEGESVFEPHLLGRNRRGETLVRAWQVEGTSRAKGWRLLRLTEIEQAVETGEKFTMPRPGYKPRDLAMPGGIIERF